MGQNFLVEPDIVREIADIAEVVEGTRVLEIGPGLGILTRELLDRHALVHAVELDRDLASVLRTELGYLPNLTVEERDARYIDTHVVFPDETFSVVANLPYSMATVIIRRLIESPHPPLALTVMVQREVAERMTARPGNMSLLGLATQYFTDPQIRILVPASVFEPQPKVESAVVYMNPRQTLPLTAQELDQMFVLAAMAFRQKRKTVTNSLSSGLKIGKDVVETAIIDLGIDPMRRPQTLSVDDWCSLARTFAP